VKSVGDDAKLEGVVLTHEVNVTQSVKAETYDFNITDGTATAGEDYNATPAFTENVTYNENNHSITVPAGVTTFNVLVQSLADDVRENNETYTIAVGSQTATGTIIDDAPIVVVSISDARNTEGHDNRHHVVLSAIPNSPVDLHLSFENITTSDSDYDRIPTFDNIPGGSIISLNDAADTITVTGLKEFDVVVYLERDQILEATEEEYNITIDGQSAIGRIQEGH